MLKNSYKIAILLVFSVINLTSCVKTTQNIGYTFDSKALDSIKIGESRKGAVKQKLGSPSATSMYGGETWYYISTEYERFAFFNPEIKNRKIVAISFATDQKVTNIRQLDGNDANKIRISRDKTPTVSDDLGVVEQLLGNMGRFNKNGGDQLGR